MPTEDSPTVEFLCRESDTDLAPEPVTAAHQFPRLLRQQEIPHNYAESTKKDTKVTDAVTFGWYLAPPETIQIEKSAGDADPQLTSGANIMTEKDTPVRGGWAGVVDSLWHITVPEGYLLLVTSPAYQPGSPVLPQVLTATDSPTELRIPVHTTRSVTLSHSTPFVQILPFSTDVLTSADSVVGPYSSDIQHAIKKREKLRDVYENPYKERIWQSKPSTPTVE